MNDYLAQFRGNFRGILKWPELTRLWQTLHQQSDKAWYLYQVGETPPSAPVDHATLERFIDEIDALLREQHAEAYCGIVYADNPTDPGFIKIYDPDNLGVVCGFSDNPPLPGWVLSLTAPVDLPTALPPPKGRSRWWQRLFS